MTPKQGNAAVHRHKPITANEAAVVVRELFHVMFWLARTYAPTPEEAPHPNLAFDLAAIPRPVTPEQRQATLAALRKKAEEQAARDAELERARAENDGLQAELERLRAEVAAAKAVNAARPDDHDYDEDATRDLYIDLLLREAGWPLDESRDREFEVTGMPNATGVGYIDYVLWGDDGKPLAVVEAKRTRRDANVGRQQAKLYADCLERRYGQRPVIFYSNGYETWLWDDLGYPPRAVQGFYTKDELALLINRRTSRRPLASLQISSAIVERHYQQRAIRRIAATFEQDNQRKALVVMATGAGKTRTVVALIDLLHASGMGQARAVSRRPRRASQSGGRHVQGPSARRRRRSTSSPSSGADGRVYVVDVPDDDGPDRRGAGRRGLDASARVTSTWS